MGRAGNPAARYALAARLSAARKKSGVTYKQLARETGIPLGSLSGYMSGYTSPSPEKLQTMARVIGVGMEELLK